LLTTSGHDIGMLYVVITADNLSGGLANAAFIAFLSSLTNISFTAVQYAIFSSLMTLIPKILGGYSGSIVESIGFESFFLMTALMSVPVLVLILFAAKRFNLNEK
ncbi:MAG TPA: MFS transporter, partial [Methylophaga aminisulfidivorans]|nr:MFS transporter [Methylophaga aminisulfidivorans]